MTLQERLARNLKTIRQREGLTQDMMAFAVGNGCKRSSWSGYENGTTEPSVQVLWQVQGRFGIGVDVLFTTDLWNCPRHAWKKMVADMAPRCKAWPALSEPAQKELALRH